MHIQELAQNHKKIILLWKAQKAEFLRLGVPRKNIRVEVGSAADKIEDRPVFYHLIDDELKEKCHQN
jgi:hypothetical protein